MNKNIHPEYKKCKIQCACGSVLETLSVVPEIKIEICCKCHPLFTGKKKIVDVENRVAKFKRKYNLL